MYANSNVHNSLHHDITTKQAENTKDTDTYKAENKITFRKGHG